MWGASLEGQQDHVLRAGEGVSGTSQARLQSASPQSLTVLATNCKGIILWLHGMPYHTRAEEGPPAGSRCRLACPWVTCRERTVQETTEHVIAERQDQ